MQCRQLSHRRSDVQVEVCTHRMAGLETEQEQLLAGAWGHADYGGGRTVDVHVAQVRAKLGDASPIRTVRGVGYTADAP